SRLVTEFGTAAHHDGATVLHGRCDEELRIPYQPFVEALRHYVTHAPDDVLRDHVRGHDGELSRLVPELSRRVGPLDEPPPAEPELERYRLFDAVASLLAAESRRAPVVLLLEDLHWADQPTLLLLRHLARWPEPTAVAIVA